MGEKRKKKKSSVEWFRPVLPVKKAQEKKIWRGECSNVPKKSKSGVGKKKNCVPCACGASMYPTNVDHQQNIFKIGNPSGEPVIDKKKKKKTEKRKKKNPPSINGKSLSLSFSLFSTVFFPSYSPIF